ncbi:MAG TPA: nitronate monooxygenase [Mycobacteriales bacterium]|jgi:NAD(P)H-dependent flavin oxidoreductase YrpB (nitropropane dioxygenase family)|nr:nitronate monooxygenase [Mycobacteriales bacterium]
MDLRERLGIDVPVVQAGMGGGISRAELAAAVSSAGALGTIGILPPPLLRAEARSARERCGDRPVAVNLLMPFVAREHVEVCVAERVPVVTLFCGHDREVVDRLHEAGAFVFHQVGTVAGAERALADGADGLVVQGAEAGGHVLAEQPLRQTLPAVLTIAGERPVLAAGGMVDASDVRAAAERGASGVVAGTRFLLTDECHAHPDYKQRALGATDTVMTTLFAAGWRDPHRVVRNAAVRRWCSDDGRPRAMARTMTTLTMPVARRVPMSAAGKLVARQRVGLPMFSPAALLRGDDPSLVEVTPLYAGTGAARIASIVPAAEAVRLLTP